MTSPASPAPGSSPIVRTVAAAALAVVVLAVIAVALVGPGPSRRAWSVASSVRTGATGDGTGGRAGGAGSATAADGALDEGVSVFDDSSPSVANLDPELLGALRAAATDAAADGVTFVLNSGWRSSAYQEQLLVEAIAEYGSEEEAARWVAPPDRSAHVSGDAVDIGPTAASSWLAEHGAAYGLCRTYRNEPWHHELRPEAVGGHCPAMYADPTQDPRLGP